VLLSPFQPSGQNKSQKVAVGTSATALAINTSAVSASQVQYWIENNGSNWIYWEAAANAATGAAAPTASTTTSPGIPPNTVVVVTAPPAAQFSFIAAATGNTVGVTPGEGA
jgi:hypothetical protein